MSTAAPAPSVLPPSALRKRPRRWLDALYPAIWRWHFWAGLLVAPVLVVVSLTGALFVFHDEINAWLHPGMHRVEPGEVRLPYGARLAAVRAHFGEEWRPVSFSESDDPAQADEFFCERDIHPAHEETQGGRDAESDDHEHAHEHAIVMVNPYTAEITGTFSQERSFMGIVLRLHRSLLGGPLGRIVVELATCWGIVSLLTGLLLWWPRLKEKVRGVWLPRFGRGGKIALRDLHTVPGIYILLFAFLIMFTGLLFSSVWGRGFFAGLYFARQLPASYVAPPKSALPSADATPLSIDEAIAIARKEFDFDRLSVAVPEKPDASWMIGTPLDDPLKPGVFVFVDAYSGKILDKIIFGEMPPGARIALWFYSVHVGSIFGLPTQILAVITCLAIVLMSVTGVMMWWRRRPRGKFGAPRKSPGSPPVPKTIVCVIVFLGVIFPLVGASLLLLLAGQLIVRRVRRKSAQ
ncbi:MAG: PepSY domain-containing protein [Opitutaceae bacterium]|jgi:uncharacterized iron-regulated membrane protein|nr:PepSY domain-containing protein [Opitutaceae bacterium]